MPTKNDRSYGFGRPNGLIPKPAGILRNDAHLAGYRDGTVAILPGCELVTAVEELTLDRRIEYALDESLPPDMFLNGQFLVQAVRPPVLPNRTRRCLVLYGADGHPLELWLYLEPERQWAVTNDPHWISAILD